jgi:hypothetical protein
MRTRDEQQASTDRAPSRGVVAEGVLRVQDV